MIKLISKKVLIAVSVLLLAMSSVNAGSGDLFNITGSGTPATLDTQLCLSVNGATPWSCENHTVMRQTLSIRTVTPNHTYPAAGIKVFTAGYTVSGCTFLSNGYCQFSVSNTNPATVNVTFLTEPTLTGISPTSGTASGATGFTVTGTNLTGATGITFGGIAATFVNVVSSTTVTGVTPVHAAGAVDVVITTPEGTATLTNGYTYEAPAVGQPSGGGVIACLSGGLNNLIAATADAPTALVWGTNGNTTNATSTTNGATNTTAIVVAEGAGTTYAAGYCHAYQVDSQGNSPCQDGNACYSDWFLPAGNNLGVSGQLNCLYINKLAIGGFTNNFYWSSTEADAAEAWSEGFVGGNQGNDLKSSNLQVRCVRSFTP